MVECLTDHYCDFNKGDVISGWIDVANLNEVNSLDKLNLLTVFFQIMQSISARLHSW